TTLFKIQKEKPIYFSERIRLQSRFSWRFRAVLCRNTCAVGAESEAVKRTSNFLTADLSAATEMRAQVRAVGVRRHGLAGSRSIDHDLSPRERPGLDLSGF